MFGKKRFLWMLLTATTMAAQTGDKDNKPLRDVSSPNPPQRPRIVYRPHGIQVAAPFPARRNWPQNPPRPRPGAYPPGVGFDPRHRISGPRLPPGYQPLRNGQAFGPGIQVATAPLPARRNWPQHPLRARPGAYPPGVGFDPRFPRISGPLFPPGYPPLRNGQAFGPVGPKDPWFGPPMPTPLGPYSHRRPVQPPTNLKPQVPLAPLPDLDGVQSTVASDSNETLKWHPDDTWRGAQHGRVAPPAPAELHALVPHYLRVEGPRNNDSNLPDSEEVGYVDEMPPEDSGPQYSEETDRHTIQNTPPSPRFITRGKLRRGSPSRPPPPLLADDDTLFHDDAALFHDDAALLSDDAADDRTPRVVRVITFDPLLLL